MTEPGPIYLYGERYTMKSTPHQQEIQRKAAYQWHRLLTKLQLPEGATWEDALTEARRPCTEAENAATDNDGADYRELEF